MLMDWKGNIKLCDFGISGRLVDSKAKTQTAGCAAYMAVIHIGLVFTNWLNQKQPLPIGLYKS